MSNGQLSRFRLSVICRDSAANVGQIANLSYALPAYVAVYHGDSQRTTFSIREVAVYLGKMGGKGCFMPLTPQEFGKKQKSDDWKG